MFLLGRSGTRHGRIWLMILIAASVLFGMPPGHAAPTQTNYNGHYELADPKAARTFALDVKQTDSRAEVSFSAAMADGSGAAPDGAGKGRVEDGVLSFDFTDSFGNEGSCTLEPGKGGYLLSMTVLKVSDPSPFHFYGSVVLKKISDKPQ